MMRPATNSTTNSRRVAATRGPRKCIQRKVWISSAVSNTAGMTVENAIVESRLNSRGLNSSRPRYCQFAVRRLISSNNHQIGAEKQKSSTKLFRERDQSELPARVKTRASTTRIYPSQSGKNSQEVRAPGTIQLSGQQTATNSSPAQPRAGQSRLSRTIFVLNIRCARNDALLRTHAQGNRALFIRGRRSAVRSQTLLGRRSHQIPTGLANPCLARRRSPTPDWHN